LLSSLRSSSVLFCPLRLIPLIESLVTGAL
jgi:hypothetical protein